MCACIFEYIQKWKLNFEAKFYANVDRTEICDMLYTRSARLISK